MGDLRSRNWLFFDIGNVLWLDEPMICEHWIALYELVQKSGRRTSFEQLMNLREQLVREHEDPVPHLTVTTSLLGVEGWQAVRQLVECRTGNDWHRYNILIDGAVTLLEELAASYNLAAAANQPATARAHLEELGLLRYFRQVGVSDEMGAEKPDPAFFTALLRQAACEPARAVMIGDRIDNDILPAKSLGMRTVWMVLDVQKHGYWPHCPLHRAYVRSLQSAPSRGRGRTVVQPDATARNFGELRRVIGSML